MWYEGLLELVFPVRCASCDAPGAPVCASCMEQLAIIDRTTACEKCGAPRDSSGSICRECHGRHFPFSSSRSVGVFEPPLSELVTVYKDAGERRLASSIASLMAGVADEWLDWADALVPVPPRAASLATRGFDHMRLIATAISGLGGPPTRRLLAVGDRADQRRLGREERIRNTADSYRMATGVEVPGNILLVDDVFTTGSTLSACAEALMGAGAREIRCLTLARATDIGRH